MSVLDLGHAAGLQATPVPKRFGGSKKRASTVGVRFPGRSPGQHHRVLRQCCASGSPLTTSAAKSKQTVSARHPVP